MVYWFKLAGKVFHYITSAVFLLFAASMFASSLDMIRMPQPDYMLVGILTYFAAMYMWSQATDN